MRNMLLHFGLTSLFLTVTAGAQTSPGFDAGAIDRKADPCVDFFQFACGAWNAANPVPGDQSTWGRFDALAERNRDLLHTLLKAAAKPSATRTPLEQKMGDFYGACMDEAAVNTKGLAPVKPTLDRIAAIKDKSQLADAIADLYRLGFTPLFHFGAGPDAKKSSQMIADLDQGGIGLPDRDYYFKTDAKSEELRTQYVAHVQKMLELAGVADVAAKARAVMAIETALAKGSLDRVARRDPEKLYHKMTVKELQALGSNFAWTKFLVASGAPRFVSLNVDVPDFVKAVDGVMASSSLDDIKAYLTWYVLHDTSTVLSEPFQKETFNFFSKTLRGVKEQRLRWKRCVDLTDQMLPDALGRKFVESTLGQEGIRRTREMVGEIEKAMEGTLEKLDWMSATTKVQAMTKLHAVMNKIGTNDKWQNYSTVRIAANDFFGNSVRASQYASARDLAKIGKPVDKKEWGMSQPTVNAYYDPSQNNINFPAGILQPPFFDNKMDDAVNFGGIGAVIGHELTHGFDDEGRQYDAVGNLRDWWTEADGKAFDQRAQCFVDQYSGYTAVDDVKLNGKLTLGENTADNGGLRLAYIALMSKLQGKEPAPVDGFTAAQRLFLGWGQVWCQNRTPEAARLRAQTDPHSPGQERVNGVVSNMPEFQKAFACRTAQPMVRGPACRVW